MKKEPSKIEGISPATEPVIERGAEAVVENQVSEKTWLDIMMDAKGEFPIHIQDILDRIAARGKLANEEKEELDVFRDTWWRSTFGTDFALRKFAPEEKPSKFLEEERSLSKRKSKEQKWGKMMTLYRALKDLDEGRPIRQFDDRSRKTLYHDHERNEYFVEQNGIKRYLGLGDVVADYAWGIMYAPDVKMNGADYRRIAKRILINETRRDIEGLRNRELLGTNIDGLPADMAPPLSYIERNWPDKPRFQATAAGFVAEMMTRELFTRISLNKELPFTVMRSNPVEDAAYKSDFKIRTLEAKPRTVGVQFTLVKKRGKFKRVMEARERIKQPDQESPVDSVAMIQVSASEEFKNAFTRWLENGKPAGGPEQYLSNDLKTLLLKKMVRFVLGLNLSFGETEKYLN
ncbi:MAG: hypothetical protein HYT29_02400 [Parcubacteria group bacterium]|nr:hypothetical protein [Parcubacteria group bacterium]